MNTAQKVAPTVTKHVIRIRPGSEVKGDSDAKAGIVAGWVFMVPAVAAVMAGGIAIGSGKMTYGFQAIATGAACFWFAMVLFLLARISRTLDRIAEK